MIRSVLSESLSSRLCKVVVGVEIGDAVVVVNANANRPAVAIEEEEKSIVIVIGVCVDERVSARLLMMIILECGW